LEVEELDIDTGEPLVKGEEATSEAVRAALQDTKPLFHFGDHRIRRIGQEAGK
jgi:hypothetical protein